MVLVTNGRLITRDSEGKGYYEHGAVAYEGAKIVEVGEEAALRAKYADAEIVDAKGGVIMPAFINAHTHIYSALARGLSIVGNNPTNFYEVLDGTWWAIDRHLMMDGTRASATALYIDSIKQGVTTIFDHHASYGEIPGTLFTISEESRRLGLRSCLCYEVSDRDGEEKCLQAIKENADFITYCQKQNDPMLAAMFGGICPVLQLYKRGILLGMGTDAYTNDMLESLKVALCSQRSQNCLPNVGWCEVTDMLFKNNAKIGARYFPDQLGVLKAGAAADIIVMDYKPFTPFSDENIDGRQCQTTIAAGKVLMKDRVLVNIDEEAENAHILEAAKKLWGDLNHRVY